MDPRELQARVEAAVARAAQADEFLRHNPPRVSYDGFVCEGCTVAEDEPLVTGLSRAYERVHGARPELRPTTATTDARHFVRSGIPAVCFGPRAESYHGIDERVSVRSILDCAQVLCGFIVEWCNRNEEGQGWKTLEPKGTWANTG
jgi:acetylornithine deacetylase